MFNKKRHFVVVSLLVSTFTVVALICVLIPEVQRARDLARHTQCHNNLFQHSGSHPTDVVYLNGEFEVDQVYSCPVCSRFDGALCFVREGKEILTEDLPESVVLQAVAELERYKQSPSYQRIRGLKTAD